MQNSYYIFLFSSKYSPLLNTYKVNLLNDFQKHFWSLYAFKVYVSDTDKQRRPLNYELILETGNSQHVLGLVRRGNSKHCHFLRFQKITYITGGVCWSVVMK